MARSWTAQERRTRLTSTSSAWFWARSAPLRARSTRDARMPEAHLAASPIAPRRRRRRLRGKGCATRCPMRVRQRDGACGGGSRDLGAGTAGTRGSSEMVSPGAAENAVNTELRVAVIAAVASLAGALVGGATTYLANRDLQSRDAARTTPRSINRPSNAPRESGASGGISMTTSRSRCRRKLDVFGTGTSSCAG